MENNVNTKNNSGKKNIYMKAIIAIIVVLIVSIGLLIFLLTGSISNRNKLVCKKTTNENGYTYEIKNVYSNGDKGATRIDHTYTFNYNSNLTDDLYNDTFDSIINSSSGVTEYGFETKISRDGNVVTITAYVLEYFSGDFKTIKKNQKSKGFSCR